MTTSDTGQGPTPTRGNKPGLVAAVLLVMISVIVVLGVFARGPVLTVLGEIAGPDQTFAVILGWALYGVPWLVTVAFVRRSKRVAKLAPAARRALVLTVLVSWFPAIAELPGRGSPAASLVARGARAAAPETSGSLLHGTGIGLATFLVAFVGSLFLWGAISDRNSRRLSRGQSPIVGGRLRAVAVAWLFAIPAAGLISAVVFDP